MIVKERTVALKDESLLRQQCYIDGQWVDATTKQARL